MNYIKVGELCPSSTTPERVLFFGDKVDPYKLLGLDSYAHTIFGSETPTISSKFEIERGNICPTTPYLFAAGLVLQGLTEDLTFMAVGESIPVPHDFLSPIIHRISPILTLPEIGINIPASWALLKRVALGITNTGIALVEEGDYKGVYVVDANVKPLEKPLPNNLETLVIRRVLNSARLRHDKLWLDIESSLIRSYRLRDDLPFVKKFITLLLDNIPEGVWIHTIISDLLTRMEVNIPPGYLTFTLSQGNAQEYLRDV